VNPAVKYTLGRIGLFIAALLVLLPFTMISFLLKLVLALLISSALSWFVLRGWREQYSLQLQNAVEKRKADKDKLRSALAGDDEPDHPTDAPQSTEPSPKDTDKPA
jgi:cytoskeletal protein RodZ